MRLLIFLLFLLGGLAFVTGLAVSPRPETNGAARVSLADMERGQAILDSLRLGRIQDGERRELRLTQQDLTLVLNWLAARARGHARVEISEKRLETLVSLPLGGWPLYLNLAASLKPEGETLAPDSLRLGRLPLPASATAWLLGSLLERSPAAEQARIVRSMLLGASLEPEAVTLTLIWRGAALRQALAQSGWNVAGVMGEEVEQYRAALVKTPGHDFAVLAGAAFALARERSGKGDPVLENRAAITALAEVALGGRLFPGKRARDGIRVKRGAVLAGRGDYAQHFGLSAFLAMLGGEKLTDLAGLYKEMQDAREGSGFSFTDLAADRAGSRFGQYASGTPEQARRVQERLAGVTTAAAFMPHIQDLPEFLPEKEFVRRFGGIGQPAYLEQVNQIEDRVSQLPLYAAP